MSCFALISLLKGEGGWRCLLRELRQYFFLSLLREAYQSQDVSLLLVLDALPVLFFFFFPSYKNK